MPWDTPYNLLRHEIAQRRDEGCVVPDGLLARIDRLDPDRDAWDEAANCNGATVGAIVGARTGRARFGDELAGRLHDTIRPAVIGFGEVGMRALAERTLAQFRRVEEAQAKAAA